MILGFSGALLVPLFCATPHPAEGSVGLPSSEASLQHWEPVFQNPAEFLTWWLNSNVAKQKLPGLPKAQGQNRCSVTSTLPFGCEKSKAQPSVRGWAGDPTSCWEATEIVTSFGPSQQLSHFSFLFINIWRFGQIHLSDGGRD